ncbi:nucleotide exchange factor GrpE [Elongatibacter sediminis]|uniref:Protein GrpE n=1 Tax=Elongatibacter sediminis TaxID=3119006 RepID=A0AAW9RCQ8_9GAMM
MTQDEQKHPAPEAEDAGRDSQDGTESGGASAQAEAAGDGETGSLEEQLAAAERELAQHREAMLRMQAEMDNQRKRLARDQERSRKFALEGIIKDLLEVRDSLERGLQMADESSTAESLREGKELTLKMLSKVLADHGLEEIDPAGEAFDPEQHEAMTMQPSEDQPENTVLEVLQKGYLLHDRLIRPARVIVSRQP